MFKWWDDKYHGRSETAAIYITGNTKKESFKTNTNFIVSSVLYLTQFLYIIYQFENSLIFPYLNILKSPL